MPQSQTGHVFISYSRRDDAVMRRVVKYLRGRGIKAWVDNEKLIPGTPVWEHEIEKAIKEAFAIVVILSPDAKKSEWVLREITLADQYQKRAFPVLVTGKNEDSIPFRLITRQFVDIRENESAGLNSLSSALSFYLEEQSRLEEEHQSANRELEQLNHERETAKKAERIEREKARQEVAERAARQKAKQEEIAVSIRKFLQSKVFKRIWISVTGLAVIALSVWGFSKIQLPAAQTETPGPTATLEKIIIETPTGTLTPSLFNQIMQRGSIRIGVRGDSAWPFDIVDGTSHSGFDIDLAEEIVRRLFNDQVSIQWIPLTAADRHIALQNSDIDMLIRAYVHMTSREEFGLWTSNYFLDGPRLLVWRDSGIESFEDLDGGVVVFTSGSPYETILQDAADYSGIYIEPFIVNNSDQAYLAVQTGQADALLSNWAHLLFLTEGNTDFQIIGELFSPEPYGIVIPPNNPEFREDIDVALLSIISDGTWQEIYDRWFTDPPPWTLEQMLAELPVDR